MISVAAAAALVAGRTFAWSVQESKDTPQDETVQDDTFQDDAVQDTEKVEEEAEPRAKGRVLYEGDLPAVKELSVPERAAEGCCPPGEEVDREDRSLRISKDRGIAGVVATVTVKDEEVEVPDEPYEVDQKGCRFEPHVLVVPKGAKVAFLNSDETSHNVHLISVLNDPLNQTVLAGKKIEKEFDEPERIKVTCDMHSWMKSWVVVTEATHWAVTDEDGAFAFEGLPPGTHEVEFWHETLGTKKGEIVVDDEGEAEPIEVEMTKKKSKRRRRR